MRILWVIVVVVLVVGCVGVAVWYIQCQKETLGLNKAQPVTLAEAEGSFFCPVAKEYCDKAQVVTVRGEYFGLGYELPAGTMIYTVLNSKMVNNGGVGLSTGDGGVINYNTISMQSETQRAVYVFDPGDYRLGENVTVGVELTQVTGMELDYLGQVNLVVYWTNMDNQRIRVMPEDVGR